MGRRKAFNLVELLIAIAVLTMLLALLVPSLSAARASARRSACLASLHAIHNGLTAYAVASQQRLPPFAYSSGYQCNLPLSGHWGGADRTGDPDAVFRIGMAWTNLHALVLQQYLRPGSLVCPAADLRGGGLFPRTGRFSTYCLRLPYSRDLFAEAPSLTPYNGQLLGVYLLAAGGQPFRVGPRYETVPQVRMDRRYTIDLPGMPVFDPASSPIVADQFHYQDQSLPAPADGASVRRAWWHGSRFQVLYGDGSARTVTDDGTIAANSAPPGGALTDDGKACATYAENVWRFFAAKR